MKITLDEKYVVDNHGHRTNVILSLDNYQKLLELLEDLEDNAYIKKHKNEKCISLDKFLRSLEKKRLV